LDRDNVPRIRFANFLEQHVIVQAESDRDATVILDKLRMMTQIIPVVYEKK
jgi:hypothetical protein